MSNTNLKRINPPSPTRAFKTPSSKTEGLETVRIAIEKHCSTYEYEQIVNGYRRSDATSEGVIEDFMRNNIPKRSVIKDEHYEKALKVVHDLFKPDHNYRPVHYADLRWYPWTLNTSVEAPFSDNPGLKKRVLEAHQKGDLPNANMNMHNCYNEVFVYNRPLVHEIKEGNAKGDRFFYYAKAHARAHLVEEKDEDKVRMVYGIPKLLLMVELMFLWPLFQWFRHMKTPMAWGYEILNGGFYKIQQKFESLKRKPKTMLGADWKQFDRRALFEVIDDVHRMWKSWMIFDKGYIPTKDYQSSTSDPQRFDNLYRWMCQAVKFMKIRLPDGSEWKRKFASIGSGLLETQILDSFVNATMLLTCLSALGYRISSDMFILIMGDDSLAGLEEFIPKDEFHLFLSKLAIEADRRFGAILNVKKSMMTRDLNGMVFLGYENHGTIPKRDPLALLAQLLFPERRVGMSQLMARAVGITYASAGQSQLVYDVCKEVYDHGASLGYTPDESHFAFLYFLDETRDVILDKFPTIEEVQKFLIDPVKTPPFQNKSFWNTDHFLSEY